MNKVKTLIYLSLLLVSIISCDNNKDEVQPKDLIIGKWQLVDLVNISDKDKYLNETLEIRTDNQYLHNNYNGDLIAQGTWSYEEDKDYIQLSNGLYGEKGISYQIIEKTTELLKLEEHYTLDNKDSYLEYHYQRIE